MAKWTLQSLRHSTQIETTMGNFVLQQCHNSAIEDYNSKAYSEFHPKIPSLHNLKDSPHILTNYEIKSLKIQQNNPSTTIVHWRGSMWSISKQQSWKFNGRTVPPESWKFNGRTGLTNQHIKKKFLKSITHYFTHSKKKMQSSTNSKFSVDDSITSGSISSFQRQ